MREHLFRGKRCDNGEFVFGFPFENFGNYYISPKDSYQLFNVIPETVGEFTGLTDKNGVKIFEGDIGKIAEVIFLVKWNKQTGAFCGVSEIDDVQTKHLGYVNLCEVIGNIHDNPELLKEASE